MSEFEIQCPVPLARHDIIQIAHGGGGRMSQRLIESVFLSAFANEALANRHDASVIQGNGKLAITTDAFVVTPWRFPGGDIGSLAVHGTVNDLAMAGARPIALSASFILEEGLSVDDLREVVRSMQNAASEAGVPIVTGDTKVVERGKADGLYISTTGIGEVIANTPIGPTSVRPGDAILLSGDVGRHGAAIMTAREGLELNSPIESDAASVHLSALALIDEGIDVHCMRDATRGGLATVLNEISRDSGFGIAVSEDAVPVTEDVRGICELLGLDPLYVACEGRFIAFVPDDQADRAISIMRRFSVSSGTVRIGTVREGRARVTLKTQIGVERVLDLLSGEQLPRIC
ncbi:MAG: hydrogenase expression/formation protein HypE [Fimbriimonas sp.]|nr:hydrogenase expression/formation protein HypE [Fimbriimonas sp.]